MSVADLLGTLHQEIASRAYFSRLDVLEQTATLLKARLYISAGLFVQVYRNERFDTTNFVLIHNEQRIYARDQLDGVWHRHSVTAPDLHDTSTEGRVAINLSEFLDEVETVLTRLDLP
ncbi:MAG: hypothetical protein HZC40_01680 [Chloroflexi bacterium]|nr:hypothetical protein [Chloroflexota bacterium]